MALLEIIFERFGELLLEVFAEVLLDLGLDRLAARSRTPTSLYVPRRTMRSRPVRAVRAA